MNRRGFLTLLGSAAIAPALPATGAAAPVVGYTRYMYGLAVFHAATRPALTAAELAQKMRIPSAEAQAMISEMTQQGMLVPDHHGGFRATRRHTNTRGAYRRRADRRNVQSESGRNATQTDQPRTQTNAPSAQETTMEKFETLSGIAAPMPLVNIDTDMIIPKQFLKTIKRSGLGVNLFDEMRYDDDGKEIEDFVLNKPQYRDAKIIVAGDNFGCGSSREHAPWALLDFGIKCVISTSFADIFFNNCFKNGILPIVLPQEAVDTLMNDAEKGANARMTVDLEAQTVTSSDGESFAFDVDAFKKHCLINGLDDIGLTMEKAASIDSFETTAAQSRPWV